MKLDINRAWSEALALIQSNIGVVSIVAGVFFFLPYLAFVLLMPDMAGLTGFETSGDDPSAVFDRMMEVYAGILPAMLLLAVAQTVGTIALLALLRDRSRPTVGQALVVGFLGFFTYIAASLIVYIGFGVVAGLLLGGAGALGITALVVILAILALVGFVYLAIKFSLLAPVIAVEKAYNPIKALFRSWRLTKGNSLRLLAFYVLLIIAVGVVSIVLGLLVGLIFGLFGAEVATIGGGIVNGALNAAYVVLFLGILAAVHRQLAGPDVEELSQTFE